MESFEAKRVNWRKRKRRQRDAAYTGGCTRLMILIPSIRIQPQQQQQQQRVSIGSVQRRRTSISTI